MTYNPITITAFVWTVIRKRLTCNSITAHLQPSYS